MGMTMRFMLPTFGLYILAGLWLVRQCTLRAPWQAAAGVALAIVAVQFLWGVPEFLNTVRRLAYQKEMLARITVAFDKVAQPGDVVVVGNAVGQQLDFVRKWKVADQNVYRMRPPGGADAPIGVPAASSATAPAGMGDGVNVAANPDQQNDNEAPSPQQLAKMIERSKNYTGTLAQREQKFMAEVQHWAGNHNVWLVGPEQFVMLFSSRNPAALPQVVIARRVELPDPPPIPQNPGRGRGGPQGQGPGPQGPGFGPQGPGQPQGPQGQGMVPQGQGPGPQGPGLGRPGLNQGAPGLGGRGLAGGQPMNPGGQPQGPGPGRGPGGGPGGGPMGELNGQTELVIARWILQ
jgi:hypothetical protein